MNNEGHGNDLQKIIAQGFDELKHIHGESFDPQKVNLAELERITGLSRSRLRTLKKKGFDMAGTSAMVTPVSSMISSVKEYRTAAYASTA